MSLKKTNGFTLIEVLVSSVILFLVISIAAQFASNSLFVRDKVDLELSRQTYFNVIEQVIESEVRPLNAAVEQEHSFQIDNIQFMWTIQDSKKIDNLVLQIAEGDENGKVITPADLRMFYIRVVISSGNSERVYSIKKVGWLTSG